MHHSPRARRAHDDSRQTALILYDTYLEDVDAFVQFFSTKELSEQDVRKIEGVIAPHLRVMRDYFVETNAKKGLPVDIQRLKQLTTQLYALQKHIDSLKMSDELRDRLTRYRSQIKTSANAMCVRAMLLSIQ